MEDIKLLKELLKEFKIFNDLDGIQDLRPYIKAIENLLKERKELEYKCEKALDDLVKSEKENKEKIKELENADLTTVYMNGFYDGEKKWKDKIKDKINYIESTYSQINGDYFMMNNTIETLQELLEGE